MGHAVQWYLETWAPCHSPWKFTSRCPRAPGRRSRGHCYAHCHAYEAGDQMRTGANQCAADTGGGEPLPSSTRLVIASTLPRSRKDLPNAMHGSRLTIEARQRDGLVIRRRRNRRWRKTTVQNRNPIRCLDLRRLLEPSASCASRADPTRRGRWRRVKRLPRVDGIPCIGLQAQDVDRTPCQYSCFTTNCH